MRRCLFRLKQPLADHFQQLCNGQIQPEAPMPSAQVIAHLDQTGAMHMCPGVLS